MQHDLDSITDRGAALNKLLQQVIDEDYDGEIHYDLIKKAFGFDTEHFRTSQVIFAWRDNNLSAAEALHTQLLAGWNIQIRNLSEHTFEVSVAHPTLVMRHDAVCTTISCAWLIAIITALS